MELINWKNEAENLKKADEFEMTPFFKATEGKHKILILNERGFKDVQMPDGTVQKRLFLDIETNQNKYTWSVTHGSTKLSLFGQLALLGSHWDGLQGKLITLVVKGKGLGTRYSIREAEDLEDDAKAENGV